MGSNSSFPFLLAYLSPAAVIHPVACHWLSTISVIVLSFFLLVSSNSSLALVVGNTHVKESDFGVRAWLFFLGQLHFLYHIISVKLTDNAFQNPMSYHWKLTSITSNNVDLDFMVYDQKDTVKSFFFLSHPFLVPCSSVFFFFCDMYSYSLIVFRILLCICCRRRLTGHEKYKAH